MNSSASTITKPVVVRDPAEARALVQNARRAGNSVGLVPTMGALHEGHLSLVRASVRDCQFTVATIFVNPAQFGPREDFRRYPRNHQTDVDALSQHGVDLIFAPAVESIYPAGFSTYVDPPDVGRTLEGEFRPQHFRGVATVVLKLFNIIPADVAYFGQKDFQQSLVVRRMAEDLDLPLAVRVLPIVRERDGLAMSSRNAYLSDEQREQALALSRSLQAATKMVSDGERRSEPVVAEMRSILAEAGVTDVDYVAIADVESLALVDRIESRAIALVAARIGATRLIDNMYLGD